MNVDFDDLFDTEPVQDGPTEEHAEPLFSDDDDNDGNENGDGENQDDAEQKTGDADAEKPKPKKKRVSRPQPKLNGDRLCGPRGIGIMEETFSDLVFSGRGHERRDLNLLMSRMQHWAHRLFPKMPFEQTIERIEKLGKTKQVQVNVKKVRMGMNVLPTEVGTEDDPTARGEPEPDVFDELIRGSQAGAEPPSPSPPTERPATPPQTSPSTLTEEQKERMRKNREAAQLRRMRAQFTRQQQEQEEPPETEQETQFPAAESGSSRSETAAESSTVQPRSPSGRHPAEPRDGGQSPSRPADGDGPGTTSTDVEMMEEEERVSVPAGTEATEDLEEETSAARLGVLHQMSETAPVLLDDEPDTESDPAAPEDEQETMVVVEDQETSTARVGHLHQMSETVPIDVDDVPETGPIVIPDDGETEDTPTIGDTESEAIVIPDEPETDAITIPDDEEMETMMIAEEDQETDAAVPHESAQPSCVPESVQETSASCAGHLHQMSETETVPAVSSGDRSGDGAVPARSPVDRPGPEADTERAVTDPAAV